MLAPAAEETGEPDGDGDCGRDEIDDTLEVMPSASPSVSTSSSNSARSCGGDIGRLTSGAVWNGKSVGDMYLLFTFEGPATVSLGSSSMGVIGGGGLTGRGGERDEIGAVRKGDDASGAEDDDGGLGRRGR